MMPFIFELSENGIVLPPFFLQRVQVIARGGISKFAQKVIVTIQHRARCSPAYGLHAINNCQIKESLQF
jgi:hypothetical protein